MQKNSNKIIFIIALSSFLLACAEGIFYYSQYDCAVVIRFLLVLQNSIKAFFFSSIISIENVISSIDSTTTYFELLIHYTYILAIFTAPVCTATAVFRTIELFLRKKLFHFKKVSKDEIIIFGYNGDVKILLQNIGCTEEPKKWKSGNFGNSNRKIVHLITKDEIDESEELRLSHNGVIVYKFDFIRDSEIFFNKFESDRIKRVIFYENSAAKNLSLYLLFTNLIKDLKYSHLKFYCSCDDPGIRAVIEDYYNEHQHRNHDLIVFNIDELKTRKMFEEHPIYTMQTEILEKRGFLSASDRNFWDVHLLIIGFGRTGQQILLEAVNLAVLHSGSEIQVDIIDYCIEEKKNYFLNIFCEDSIEENENEIVIGKHWTDGVLRIKFHQLDVQKYKFKKVLEQIVSEKHLTYVAICLRKPEHSIHCMIEIEKLLFRKDAERIIVTPIAMRFEMDTLVAKYLEDNTALFKDVFSMPAEREVLNIDYICDETYDNSAVDYHCKYQSITITSQEAWGFEMNQVKINEDKEKLWKLLPLYKQQSNRYLSYHDLTKKVVYLVYCALNGQKADKLEDYLKSNNTNLFEFTFQDLLNLVKTNPVLCEMARLEHRRWCYFMILNGWSYGEKKDDMLKRSPCLCDWNKLCNDCEDMVVYNLIPVLVWQIK